MRLTEDILQSMTKSGEFSLRFNAGVEPKATLEILFCLEEHEPPREYMISGFPRIIDDNRAHSKTLIQDLRLIYLSNFYRFQKEIAAESKPAFESDITAVEISDYII